MNTQAHGSKRHCPEIFCRADNRLDVLDYLAGATGLEPATSGVTGRHSNQLSYAPALGDADLKGRPRQVKADVRNDARINQIDRIVRINLVGGDGIEPPTSCV
jgi:hypothetical protein